MPKIVERKIAELVRANTSLAKTLAHARELIERIP